MCKASSMCEEMPRLSLASCESLFRFEEECHVVALATWQRALTGLRREFRCIGEHPHNREWPRVALHHLGRPCLLAVLLSSKECSLASHFAVQIDRMRGRQIQSGSSSL